MLCSAGRDARRGSWICCTDLPRTRRLGAHRGLPHRLASVSGCPQWARYAVRNAVAQYHRWGTTSEEPR